MVKVATAMVSFFILDLLVVRRLLVDLHAVPLVVCESIACGELGCLLLHALYDDVGLTTVAVELHDILDLYERGDGLLLGQPCVATGPVPEDHTFCDYAGA